MKKVAIAAVTVALTLGLSVASACSPQVSEKPATDDADGVAVAFDWSADSDCATCHSTQHASLADGASLAALHPDQTCTDCHVDVEGLAGAHEGVAIGDTEPKRLKETDIERSLCQSCHVADEIVALAEDCTALTDSNGTVVNPHVLPDNDSHNDIECFDCHSAHEAAPAETSARDVCLNCHHHDIYECYTCHS